MYYLCIAFAVLFPYLLCSINPAIVAAKIKHGKDTDIRTMGSGNPGLTNTLRTSGKRAALGVLLIDVLKGVFSMVGIIIFAKVAGKTTEITPEELRTLMWIGAVTAVLGHCYPIWHKFKGGKAVLVTVATLFVLDWITALILLSIFIIIVMFTKYVSLGSIIASALTPVSIFLVGTFVRGRTDMLDVVVFPLIIALLVVYKHSENIKRLRDKTEKKLGKKES